MNNNLSPPRFFIFISLLVLPFITAQAAPVNVALNKLATADSRLSGAYPASNAVDGNSTLDASRWVSAEGMPHWIELDLGQNYVLSRMKFWTGKQWVGSFPLYDFSLQTWDGTGWVDLHSVVDSANTGAVDESFAPVVASNRVRLHVTRGEDGMVRLFELELMGEPHGLTFSHRYPQPNATHFDPSSNLVVTFAAPIQLLDASGIRVENLSTATDLAGTSISVSGHDLIISHGGLDTLVDYAVHIPANRVALASDATVTNGAIHWTFDTAPLKPQLETSTKEIPNLTDDIVFQFDRDLTLLDSSAISVRRASDNTLVTGISVSVANQSLAISHPGLEADESYIVTLGADAVAGTSNGEGNLQLRRAVFAGSIVLINATFTNGNEGFQFAKDIISGAGVEPWRRVTGIVGPSNDTQFLSSRTNWSGDFVLSPLVHLVAGVEYTLDLDVLLDRAIHVALTTTPDLENLEPIITYPGVDGGGVPQSKRTKLTPSATGNYYLIFYAGETNPNQDQQLDSIVLTRSVAPVVRILSPDSGAAFNENETRTVSVEAYGVAAPLQSLHLYDSLLPGDQLLGIPTAEGEVYSYTWAYHLPGERTLSAVATDELSNTATHAIPITVNFEDGTLPQFIGYDFDDNSRQGWTTNFTGTSVFRTAGNPGYEIRIATQSSNNSFLSSPTVNLFAGEIYTLSFRARSTDSQTQQWGFVVADVPGYPADPSVYQPIVATPSWQTFTYTFTVPYDGTYHLTLFDRPGGPSYTRIAVDDIRLIGNTNALPVVNLLSPNASIKTVQGVSLSLSASASDADGSISKVEFYRDAFKLGEVTSPPYNFIWENVSIGAHNVFARAHDMNGGYSDSSSRQVEVLENKWTTSTLLGQAADTTEAFTGTAYQSDGTLVLAGILDPTLFPEATPVYLHGASPGDKGVVALLSEDGTTVQRLVVVGSAVLDVALDDNDRIYIAAAGKGALVLDAEATTVLWSQSYGSDKSHRIAAAGDGTFVVMNSPDSNYEEEKITTSTNYLYDSAFNQLSTLGGASAYTTDVAIDSATQTVVFIGWKNFTNMEDDSARGWNPVDVPVVRGYAYDGTAKYRLYDWGMQAEGDRWLNRIKNNMADTRGSRVFIGADGYLYAGIEFDGGNTPLRDDPFDLGVTAQDRIVGGSPSGNHGMSNTDTVPKTFVGRFNAGTGEFILGQWITNRLSNGNNNTIRIKSGNIAVDAAGRIHVVGSSAAGLPMTIDVIPDGIYDGGAFHLVYSPDFSNKEFLTRLSYGGGDTHDYSNLFAVAISPSGKVATAGYARRKTFTHNAWQDTLAGGDKSRDAFFAVSDPTPYYSFQAGNHPRLFFDAAEVPALREKVTREPYASMKQRMIAMLELDDVFRPYNAGDMKQVIVRAQQEAFLYIITGDEAWAQAARANVNTVIDSVAWADPALRGLDSYWYASKTAMAYDWCATSEAWDSAFNYKVSKALLDIGKMIITNGGSDQSPSAASNWQASRGASGALALLASDHNYNADLINQGYDKVWAYLNANMGNSATTRGWNPEGLGYTYFPNGNYVGPFGIAMARHDPAKDIRNHVGLRMSYWSVFAGITPAVDVYNFGGVKNDWSDDNAHIRGEGTYNQAFYYAPESLKPGVKFWYDRMMGFGSDDVDDALQKRWDSTRGGAIWGILYYPQEVDAQQPSEIWDWHQANDDKGGIGMFTFRNTYQDANDFLAQFKARLVQVDPSAHDGPDGLGFRIIGNGTPWVIGGGRNTPGRNIGQAGLYTTEPLSSPAVTLSNTGSIHGTPLIRPDGGGHVIASMVTTNVGVSNHKRWFVASYDSAQTGVDAAYLVADTSTDGAWWQLPTHLHNTVNVTSSNTFTITAPNGATLQGTVLYPTSGVNITTGTMVRGDGYAMTSGGSIATADPPTNDTRIEENTYIRLNHPSGDFLVVLTIQSPGDGHPTPVLQSGAVADAAVSIGSLMLNVQTDNVLYNGAPYTPPTATVTFDAGIGGSITSGNAVQSVSYGAAAIQPTLSVSPGFTFVRWDRAFDAVVKDMTVRAIYYDETGNVAPTVNGGGNRTVTVNTPVTLNGSVSDDGLPNPRGFTTAQWTQLSGPGSAQFLNATVPNPTVQFPETGTYVLRMTADDGVATSQDDVTVTVTPTPGPGFLRFTSDNQTLNEADGSVTVHVERYNGGEGAIAVNYRTGDSTALAGSDYTTVAGTLSWSDGETDIKSITVPILEDVNVENTEVFVINLSQPTNGAQIGTIGITAVFIEDNDVNGAPSVTITSPIGGSAVLPHHHLRLVLEAEVSDDGQPGPVATTWSKVSGPGSASFESLSQRNTTVQFSQPGDYVLRILAHDGMEGTAATLSVSVKGGGETGLALHWRMQQNFNDASGNANHGILTGNGSTWNTGTDGDALVLNADITHVDSTSGIAVSDAQGFSAAAWVRLSALPSGGNQIILQHLDAGGTGRSWLAVTPQGRLFSFVGNASTEGGNLVVGTWHHVAVTAGGGTVKLYLDGNEVASQSSRTIESNGGVVRLGNSKTPSTTGQFLGRIDEVRAYTRLLSGTEVNVLAGGTVANIGPDVFAGNAATANPGEAVVLAGTVTDDGLPVAPGTVSLLWTKRDGLGTVGFTDVTQAASHVTFEESGTYILRLMATDGAIQTAHDVTYTVASRVLTPAETWRQTHFGITENSGNAASDADPDGDGLVNLLERALGGDPLQASITPLPTLTQIAVGAETYLRLTVNRDAEATDLNYAVEVSADLVNWSSVEGTDIVTITNTANTLEVRDATPLSPANPRRFLRLRVIE